MKYLLDTCTVSQFIRGNAGVLARVKSTPPAQICISSVTMMELEYGLQINPERAIAIRPVIESFLSVIDVISYSSEDARYTALIRSALKSSGTPIGPYDVMIAGCARYRKLIVVTDNLREFLKVEGIELENWVIR